jgi:hypothetical protein
MTTAAHALYPNYAVLPSPHPGHRRMQRAEEDVTAIITTVIETRDDVKWLKRAVQALLADRNITLDETEDD